LSDPAGLRPVTDEELWEWTGVRYYVDLPLDDPPYIRNGTDPLGVLDSSRPFKFWTPPGWGNYAGLGLDAAGGGLLVYSQQARKGYNAALRSGNPARKASVGPQTLKNTKWLAKYGKTLGKISLALGGTVSAVDGYKEDPTASTKEKAVRAATRGGVTTALAYAGGTGAATLCIAFGLAPAAPLCAAGGAFAVGYLGDRIGASINHWFFD
jgi:hypothetical protein